MEHFCLNDHFKTSFVMKSDEIKTNIYVPIENHKYISYNFNLKIIVERFRSLKLSF